MCARTCLLKSRHDAKVKAAEAKREADGARPKPVNHELANAKAAAVAAARLANQNIKHGVIGKPVNPADRT